METTTIETVELARLRREARAGQQYKAALRGEIARYGRMLGSSLLFSRAAAKCDDIDELVTMRDELERQWNERFRPRGVAETPQAAERVDPEAQAIFSRLGITLEDVKRYKER